MFTFYLILTQICQSSVESYVAAVAQTRPVSNTSISVAQAVQHPLQAEGHKAVSLK